MQRWNRIEIHLIRRQLESTRCCNRNRAENGYDWYERSGNTYTWDRSKNDPRGGVNDQIGQLYSPIPLDTGSLARSNNVSVHVHGERTCEARAAVPLGIFFTFASAAKRRGRAVYNPCTYGLRTLYTLLLLIAIPACRAHTTPARRALHLSKIIEVSRWSRPNANFVSIRSFSKLFGIRLDLPASLYVTDILLLHITNYSHNFHGLEVRWLYNRTIHSPR